MTIAPVLSNAPVRLTFVPAGPDEGEMDEIERLPVGGGTVGGTTAGVVPPTVPPPTGSLSISSISPSSGPAGTNVSLTGAFDRTGAIVIAKADGTVVYDNRKVNVTNGYYSGDRITTSFIIPEDTGIKP